MPYKDWTWVLAILGWNISSRWNESWEEMLVMTDISTSWAWAEVIIRVKWRLEIQTNVVMLWSALLLVVARIINMIGTKDGEWWLDWWWMNSLSQDWFHPGNQIPPKYATAGFKPFFFILSSSNVVIVSYQSVWLSFFDKSNQSN